jgi:diphthamide synthase subunit DPH2
MMMMMMMIVVVVKLSYNDNDDFGNFDLMWQTACSDNAVKQISWLLSDHNSLL